MGLNYEYYRFDYGFCACNDVTQSREEMVGCYLPKLGNFFQEREVRTWLLVIATGLCLLAKRIEIL